jgi:DNA-binding CsgD family transcriptional regulator
MQALGLAMTEIIGAVGTSDFAERVTLALCRLSDFDMAAVLFHPDEGASRVLFDTFDQVDGREGIRRYARSTRRMNPMTSVLHIQGALRARDFRSPLPRLDDALYGDLIVAPDEELGYLTKGWPRQQEEVSLYFDDVGGRVELGLYRKRRQRAASRHLLERLNWLCRPVAIAFERHGAIQRSAPSPRDVSPLTQRECDVRELMLLGCSTQAIALRLAISVHTVKDHRKRIFRKLEIGSLAELFARQPLFGGIAA